MVGTRAISRRHGHRGEKAPFYLIITLQYVELIACIIEIAGSIYLAVRGPGDSVAVIASIAMLIASSTSLCVLVVHQLAAKSLQGQSSREYRRRQHSLRGIMGSFLILLLIAWTTTGIFSIVEATRSAGCHDDDDDASRYWRGGINCVVQKATLAIALLMIIVTLALLAAVFSIDNAFAASLSGLHRRNHTEEEELHLSNHPIYANVTVTPYREKRIKAPLFNDTTPNFDPVYPNDSPTSIDTSSPTPRPLNQVMRTPSRGPSEMAKNAHSRQRSWLPPLKFHEHTVTLHPLQSTSAVNLLPPPPKVGEPMPIPPPHTTPIAASTPDLPAPPPRPKPPASKPPFRSTALSRTKTAATMASSVYSRHTNNTTSMTCTAHSDEADTLFSRQPSLSSLSMSSHGGSPYSSMKKKAPAAKSFIRHPATRNPFAARVAKPAATMAMAMDGPKRGKARPLPIIGTRTRTPNPNPFLDIPTTGTTNPPAPAPENNNNNNNNNRTPSPSTTSPPAPSRPHSSPSLPPSKFWMYARSVQRSANAAAVGQDGAFPVFPLPSTSTSPATGSPGAKPGEARQGEGRRRSNTVPSTGSPRQSPASTPTPLTAGAGVAATGAVEAAEHPADEGIGSAGTDIHPAFRGEMAEHTPDDGQRSKYDRLRKSGVGGVPLGVPLLGGSGEGVSRSRSKLLLKKKKGGRAGRGGGV